MLSWNVEHVHVQQLLRPIRDRGYDQLRNSSGVNVVMLHILGLYVLRSLFVAGLQMTITEEEVMTGQITMSAQDDVRRHRRIVSGMIASLEESGPDLDRMLPVGLNIAKQ